MPNDKSSRRSEHEYTKVLDAFEAKEKSNREAVQHLERLGFRSGQARSAVYQYRKAKGLVKPRRTKEE